MTPEAFRAQAHQLVDWMADYLRDVPALPVTPAVQPGQIRAALPSAAPPAGESMEAIIEDFRRLIVPGMTHWSHPGFFGYFPAGSSPESLLAEMLTATLGAQCMSWQTSPAATELEQVTMAWLRQLIGLPDSFTGVIQDTASTGTLVALITARDRCGPPHDRLTVYTSAEAHSSVLKGARMAGFLGDRVRTVAVDERFAMRADRLAEMLDADLAAGLVPAAIVATIGTTASTGVDPVPALADLAERHSAWLHVDAAYAGSAAILPECRHHFAAVERADSYLMNPHKWLGTHFDCSAYFVRDVPALLRSFSASPEYLRTAHDTRVANFRDWGIPLGRRFRALKLWFVLRSYGVTGLQTMLRAHLAMAQRFAAGVAATEGWELVAPVEFGLVCFRHRPAGMPDGEALDRYNQAILERTNASRRVFLTHAVLNGRYTLRLALGHPGTSQDAVDEAWALLQGAVHSSEQ
ncbi:MAG: aspartate aminotransferase family protein [Gemmatimonadales bacterium]